MQEAIAAELDGQLGAAVQWFALQQNTWWSLDGWLAAVILAGLKQFREAKRVGFPDPGTHPLLKTQVMDVNNDPELAPYHAEWNAVLDKMIAAFEILVRESRGDIITEQELAVAEDGLLEFTSHFRNLWD